TEDGQLSCKPLVPGKTWSIPVKVEDYQGLTAFRSVTLSTAPSGTGDNDLINTKIQVYPNPVTEKSWLYIDSNRDGNMVVEIFDLTGKKIFSRNQSIKAGKRMYPLDLNSNPAPGIYILQVSGIASYRSKICLNMLSR
ncbi:MAG: T9SS type A sorting domain-containing protein, partial [Bacteroidales bacterium]|nr:T9SS type A sorting domain-containing protein [Bacteroidales bacterium]